jgi:hypothetical protein
MLMPARKNFLNLNRILSNFNSRFLYARLIVASDFGRVDCVYQIPVI